MSESPDTTRTRFRLWVPSPAKCSVIVVSLLLVGLLIGGGWYWHQDARKAIRAIEAAGGETWGSSPLEMWLWQNYQIESNTNRWTRLTRTDADVFYVRLKGGEASESVVRSLRNCTKLWTLEISASSLSPAMRVLDQLQLRGPIRFQILGDVDAPQLAHLRNVQAIKFLEFHNNGQTIHSMTAESLEELQYLPELKHLTFVRVGLESPIPASISQLSELTRISFSFDKENSIVLPKDAWIHLKQLPQLGKLELYYQRATDAALEEASKIDGLTKLIATSVQFTDAGLEYLAQLKTLREVRFYSKEAMPEGYARLPSDLPNCVFSWDFTEVGDN